jgi:hypothetical protein
VTIDPKGGKAVVIIKEIQKSKPISSSTSSSNSNDGICAALKNYSFDCDAPGSAEQADKTLEKVTDHPGMTLGNDIQVVLETRQKLVIPDPPNPAGDPGEISVTKAVATTIIVSRSKRENLLHPPALPATSQMMDSVLHSRITHLTVIHLVQQNRLRRLWRKWLTILG